MRKYTIAASAVVLLASAGSASAQSKQEWSVGLGIGPSLVTGTPARPRPKDGDHITGAAGPSLGYHVVTFAEYGIAGAWLSGVIELSRNELGSDGPTFNCLTDSRSEKTATCYPAAKKDLMHAAVMSLRVTADRIVTSPSLTVGVGVARYTLKPEESFEGLQGVTVSRPVLRFGVAARLVQLGSVKLGAQSSLDLSLGRGGGSNRIPFTVTLTN